MLSFAYNSINASLILLGRYGYTESTYVTHEETFRKTGNAELNKIIVNYDFVPEKYSREAVEQTDAETFVDYLEILDDVPTWIATTTSYWESNSISDAQFISQIKYLIQHNLI